MKPDLKAGDIIFRNPNHYKGHFYIILEESTGLEKGNFKYFSSYDGKLSGNAYAFLSSYLNHLSEGFWEFK